MDFHQIIHTLIVNRKILIRITATSAVILFLILFFIYPFTYESEVKILPPPESGDLSGLGSLLSGQDFSSLIMGGITNFNSQLYIEILKSRSAAEYVVRKHNLEEYFDSDNFQSAVQRLQDKLSVDLSKEGIVTLSVELSTSPFPIFTEQKDSVRNFAAQLSNTYVEALDKINREKLSSRSRNARKYIEGQIVITKAKLDSVEKALVEFQKKNKAVSLPEQVKAAIDAAAELKAEIIKTEVELGYLKNSLKGNNKTVLALNEKLQQLNKQYSKMESGGEDYLVAFGDVPELGREFAELMREIKIQNEVYILLQQQYYKEKIQENRDLPTVDILDEAIPPLKPVSPRIIYSTVLGSVFIFLLVSLVLIIQAKKHQIKPRS
ncbi:MAG: hypothetical protein Kow0098_16920 [Ignavibacteriaceae bacterium]